MSRPWWPRAKRALLPVRHLPTSDKSTVPEIATVSIIRELVVRGHDGSIKLSGASLQFDLFASSPEAAPKLAGELAAVEANEAFSNLRPISERGQQVLSRMVGVESAVQQIEGAAKTWDPLLKRVARFVELTDAITEVGVSAIVINAPLTVLARFTHMQKWHRPFCSLYQRYHRENI